MHSCVLHTLRPDCDVSRIQDKQTPVEVSPDTLLLCFSVSVLLCYSVSVFLCYCFCVTLFFCFCVTLFLLYNTTTTGCLADRVPRARRTPQREKESASSYRPAGRVGLSDVVLTRSRARSHQRAVKRHEGPNILYSRTGSPVHSLSVSLYLFLSFPLCLSLSLSLTHTHSHTPVSPPPSSTARALPQ